MNPPPNPPTLRIIHIGYVERPYVYGREHYLYKKAYGPILEIEREKAQPCEGPCFRSCGSYARKLPVYKTIYASYSPIKLQAEMRARVGYPENLCGHRDCVNIDHYKIIPWSERMAQIRPKARDEKTGRYLKGT